MIGKLVLKLIGPLLKLIFPKVEEKLSDMRQEIIEHIFKIGKIEENNRYRELPNDCDLRQDKLEEQFSMMKSQMKDMAKDMNEANDVIKKLKNKKIFKSLG